MFWQNSLNWPRKSLMWFSSRWTSVSTKTLPGPIASPTFLPLSCSRTRKKWTEWLVSTWPCWNKRSTTNPNPNQPNWSMIPASKQMWLLNRNWMTSWRQTRAIWSFFGSMLLGAHLAKAAMFVRLIKYFPHFIFIIQNVILHRVWWFDYQMQCRWELQCGLPEGG